VEWIGPAGTRAEVGDFEATDRPRDEHWRSLTERFPWNPFYLPAYATAMQKLGGRPWLLLRTAGGRVATGCSAFFYEGRLQRVLDLPSFPEAADEGFWSGLLSLARRLRVWRLQVGSFASSDEAIPHLARELSRQQRREYVLDLSPDDLMAGLVSNHRRNVRRASRADVSMRRGHGRNVLEDHLRLMRGSATRRARRGESADATGLQGAGREIAALADAGAGQFFQAVQGETPVSSIFVLRAERGAYYHSAGTSETGQSLGASHFLIHEVATALRLDGLEVFNLGGAGDASPGLQRFKEGFGAHQVTLASAEFALVPGVLLGLARVAQASARAVQRR